MNDLIRQLAPQRSVSLYKDQEDRINKFIEEHGLSPRKIPDIVRRGVDLVLNEIEGEKHNE